MDPRAKQVATWQECADLCAAIAACEAWTISSSGWCFAKTSAACTGSHADWTWGTRQCGTSGATTPAPANTCDPADNDWSCCTPFNPCGLGQVRYYALSGSRGNK